MIYSQTRVIREGILNALLSGPATAREIDLRMGVKPATHTSVHLNALERAGAVVRAGKSSPGAKGGPPAQRWALTEVGRVMLGETERAA